MKELDKDEDLIVQRITIHVQNEIVAWAKRRFWIISILGTLAGLFGIYAIFQNTLAAAITERIKAPVDDHLAQMRNQSAKFSEQVAGELEAFGLAKEQAKIAVVELNATRVRAEETMQDARRTMTGAQAHLQSTVAEFNALRDKIVETRGEVEKEILRLQDLKEESARITDNSLGLYAGTFEIRTDQYIQSLLSERQEQYFNSIIDDVSRLVDSEESSIEGIRKLVAKWRGALEQYKLVEKSIYSNANVKVVLYVRGNSGFSDIAERASLALKRKGYRVDVWVANGDTSQSAIDDIQTEFPGAAEILAQYKSGIVSYETHVAHADEIKEELRKFLLFSSIDRHVALTDVTDIHLRRGFEKKYNKNDIILAYVLSE